MEKNNYNDCAMPSADDTAKMQEAYGRILMPRSCDKIGMFLNHVQKHNYHICIPNIDTITSIYAVEKNLVTALKLLLRKAKLISTHTIINRIIFIKEEIMRELESWYIRHAQHTIPYTPRVVDKPSYNALYADIEYMETENIALLDSTRLAYLTIREHSAGIMILTLKA